MLKLLKEVEVPEAICRVLLCVLEAVDSELCLLEVLQALEVL